MELSLIVVIVTALAFDFTNGFHDTANAMATSIATGALKPKVAVAISGVLNLVGAFVSTEVAKTISSGIVDDAKVTPAVVFGGLVGAILWNLVTWLVGLPSSSSHALFGGLIGATWVAAGTGAINVNTLVAKVLIPAGALPQGSAPPLWVILSAGLAIALGTAFGGWRIIRTLGTRITEIHPVQGFAAQTSSASVILVSSLLGFPLSTTQVCSGAIFGAGAGRRLARVHWGVAGQMAVAWALTLPAAAIVGAVAAQVALISTLGTVLVALVAIAVAAGIYLLSRRNPVDADSIVEVPADPAAVPTAA